MIKYLVKGVVYDKKSFEMEARARKGLAYTSNSLVNILYDYKCSDSMETISRTTFDATYTFPTTALV